MILNTSNEIRSYLIDAVRKELIGPNIGGRYIDYYRHSLNLQDSDELILADPHGAPWERYISGKLYPSNFIPEVNQSKESTENTEENAAIPGTNLSDEDAIRSGAQENTNTLDPISMANVREPSAFGLTVMVKKPTDTESISVRYNGAFYHKGEQEINKLYRDGEAITPIVIRNPGAANEKRIERLTNYWVRRPIPQRIENVTAKDDVWSLGKVIFRNIYSDNGFSLRLYVTNRGQTADGAHTLTFTIVNESKTGTNEFITYQNQICLEFSEGVLCPYTEKLYADEEQEDERQMQLLYRQSMVFGIGHGCSVVWSETSENSIQGVNTDFLPVYSVPLVAPGPANDRGEDLDLAMWNLSDMGDWETGKQQLTNMVDFYEKWIGETERAITFLHNKHVATAEANIRKCREALRRIRDGVDLLMSSEHDELRACFQWMNRAMLWQQQRSKVKQRRWALENNIEVLSPLSDGDNIFSSLESYHLASTPNSPKGRWRPFQLAFILMNLKAMWYPETAEREIVELIWFPTGGGKTEAYLGLTAFSIFARKVRNNDENSSGTSILMRYTLRLLTSQQFERAASLILGCNLIAREQGFQGEVSIGLWVGIDTTPNRSQDALEQFESLQRSARAKYNFVLLKCPCCGAQIGKTNYQQPPYTKGLRQSGTTVKFICENNECEFYYDPDNNGVPARFLPVYVIDDEIFEHAPTLVLGTVDKFAMIPWKSQGREGTRDLEKVSRIFGFRQGQNGVYRIKPPELIIQDELHLIAGPLGSMVGMYETLIQTLCNQYITDGTRFYSENFIPPKIVASSATITRAEDQIGSLYGTDKFQIFPAQGISFGETWFSYVKHEKTQDNRFYKEGRNYVGIVAPGKSAQQTIYKIYAAVYQAVFSTISTNFSGNVPSPLNIDYYWTLIGYFNSIRELAGALTLVNGNLAEYLNRIKERNLLTSDEYRLTKGYFIYHELTSRIPGYKIPDTLKKLETSFSNPPAATRCMDICLATNMIATGLDVSRLGMMFIHGQPKTTAEYIQASSRVGRQFWEGPGLVFTLYSNQKPRDKSIYEHFQAYHSRLYSYVEPTSVTPYSINVRERALHAVIIGLVRNFSRYYRYDPRMKAGNELNDIFSWIIENIIRPRTTAIGVDRDDITDTVRRVHEIRQWWNQDIYQRYGDAGNTFINRNPDQSRSTFMAAMGSETPEYARSIGHACIPTPTSMRGVDGECVLDIPILNIQNGGE